MMKDYKTKLLDMGLNVYFVAEADKDYNIEKQIVVPANPCCNCYSVAKAFAVTAFGMLYDRGLVRPETLLADVLGEYIPADADPNWRRVTLHDVMLHKAGFGSGLLDIDVDDASLYPTTDYLSIIFSTPLPHEPGSVHQYTDAAYYLISRVIAKLSGVDLAELMRPALMETMRFKEFAWSTCPQGYSMGATGLYLRTEDMVKLGVLYLNGGEWKGTRVISKEWVDIVLKNGYELKSIGDGWFAKGGMCGQQLMFNTDRGIAVACHSYEHHLSREALIG